MTTSKIPVSVFIITLNEADRIEKTILAVRDWVEEVIVVDSGSTDGTIDICEKLNVKIFQQDWMGFGVQKRFAEDKCSQDWLFNIDADEYVPVTLKEEIQSLFAAGEPSHKAYNVKIDYVYPGDTKPRPYARDYNVVRLYDKNFGRYRDHPIFDRVVLTEGSKIGQLTKSIHHFALLNWQQMIDKISRQSDSNHNNLIRKPRWLLLLRLVTGFPLNFVRNYLFRTHFIGGHKGFVFALNTAYSRTMRIAKALQTQDQAKLDDHQN